ncbi:HD domain-containing protein [Nocardia panacis]|uniref:HD domain-containing protein n=1 Tax=Nocardia panacis TaxID=2340916 RepID=A0A3A4KD60_9NOCA|nr:HD domain-containing protein [Nocardia panacis]RJO73395.1 HD domain-containing protein [Nocardia panacis]
MDANQQLDNDTAHEIAAFAFELGVLKRETRKGWLDACVPSPESVAEHTCRTAQLAALIAAYEGGDPARAAHLALWHDSQETRLRDLNQVAKPFLGDPDHEAVTDTQTSGLPQILQVLVRDTVAEFEAQATVEAVCARDADRLECLIQALEYQAAGNSLMGEWITGSKDRLKTTTAHRIAEAAMTTPVLKWRTTMG